jgi:hypothetical protein
MDRRNLLLTSLAAGLVATPLAARAQNQAKDQTRDQPRDQTKDQDHGDGQPGDRPKTYQRDEVVHAGSQFLGVTAEALGGAIEHIFKDFGDRPTAYIAGTESSGAWAVGARYGKGLIYMKTAEEPTRAFWQGPSIGFDVGGNASRVFTLCYGLDDPEKIFQRFPGVEGSAYLVGGLGVNYQRADSITLAPIRAGVGLRLGANIGYLSYSKKRHYIPF